MPGNLLALTFPESHLPKPIQKIQTNCKNPLIKSVPLCARGYNSMMYSSAASGAAQRPAPLMGCHCNSLPNVDN